MGRGLHLIDWGTQCHLAAIAVVLALESCRVHSLETRLLRTLDIKGLLGFGHPRKTACGCVNYCRIIAINVSD